MKVQSTQPLLSLANALRSGDLPIGSYIDELEATVLQREPTILALLPEEERFDRLRRDAETLIEKYPRPISRPPLFGLPVGVKDIFHVDGFATKAGSLLPAEVLYGRESQSVRILKDAGALVLGKTVTTEFAYFTPGPTCNPIDPERTAGGSSSGSAAAVAAGFCPIATATQTIGSITRPASFCGVVGYKPSYDRISRAGVIPLSPSLDHIGVLAVDVAAVELAASLLCPDWQIAVTEHMPVLGVPEGPYLARATPEGMAHFEATCERLALAGCEIRRVPAMHNFEAIEDRHKLILAAEAAQVHAQWYAEYGELYHERMVHLIERGRSISVGELAEALTGRKRLRQKLMAQMDHFGLDLWISPSAPGVAPKGLESTGDPVMNLPWTHSGLPTINLPSGTNHEGLPIGLQVTGRWYEDEALLEWAAELETVVDPGL